MENPTPQYPPAEQPKKFPTGLVIGIVVIVLCCCCAIVVLAGLTLMGPVVSNVFSTVNQDLENPTVPDLPNVPEMPTIPASLVPQGGLGDEILRADTWAQVAVAAALADCTNPSAGETTIEVTQKPDSGGAWKELWTVSCGSGKTVPVEVEYTPSASGGTDFTVTVVK